MFSHAVSDLHAGPGCLATGSHPGAVRNKAGRCAAQAQTCYHKGGTLLEWGSVLIK